MIPFASLRTQKRWLNINSTRTTQTASPPFQFLSLSWLPTFCPTRTRCWLFFQWTDVVIFDDGDIFSFWRNSHKHGGIREHAHPVKSTITIFSRLLEDKVRCLLSDRDGCWVGMSQNACVLIVGTRFCYQRSHFYSYRYCCPEIKFRLTQSTYNVVWW